MTVKEQNPKVFRVPVVDFLTEEAWGAEPGQKALSLLAPLLSTQNESVVDLDMKGVKRVDASCSREFLAKLTFQNRGFRYFYLSNISNESLLENIDMAFARQKLSILYRQSDDYSVLGAELSPQLLQTLGAVEDLGGATAKQVCFAIKDLGLTACNNRLKDLCDAGLLLRLDGTARSGGKEFLYSPLGK